MCISKNTPNRRFTECFQGKSKLIKRSMQESLNQGHTTFFNVLIAIESMLPCHNSEKHSNSVVLCLGTFDVGEWTRIRFTALQFYGMGNPLFSVFCKYLTGVNTTTHHFQIQLLSIKQYSQLVLVSNRKRFLLDACNRNTEIFKRTDKRDLSKHTNKVLFRFKCVPLVENQSSANTALQHHLHIDRSRKT